MKRIFISIVFALLLAGCGSVQKEISDAGGVNSVSEVKINAVFSNNDAVGISSVEVPCPVKSGTIRLTHNDVVKVVTMNVSGYTVSATLELEVGSWALEMWLKNSEREDVYKGTSSFVVSEGSMTVVNVILTKQDGNADIVIELPKQYVTTADVLTVEFYNDIKNVGGFCVTDNMDVLVGFRSYENGEVYYNVRRYINTTENYYVNSKYNEFGEFIGAQTGNKNFYYGNYVDYIVNKLEQSSVADWSIVRDHYGDGVKLGGSVPAGYIKSSGEIVLVYEENNPGGIIVTGVEYGYMVVRINPNGAQFRQEILYDIYKETNLTRTTSHSMDCYQQVYDYLTAGELELAISYHRFYTSVPTSTGVSSPMILPTNNIPILSPSGNIITANLQQLIESWNLK